MDSPHFPVQHSLLSAPALAEWLSANYDLPASPRCVFWSRSINDTYLVEAGPAKFMLRLAPAGWRSHEQVAAEIDLLHFLQGRHFSVPRPIPQKEGAYLQALPAPEGPRYAILFSFAPGAPPAPLSESHSYEYGQALARLHSLTDNYPVARPLLRFDFEDLVDTPLGRLKPWLAEQPGTWTELQKIAAPLKQVVESLPRIAPTYGLCHGDVNNNNFHIGPAGEWTLIDFEYAGYGWRVFDIANFYLIQLLPSDKSDQTRQIRAAFLSGYQSVRPLSPLELKALPTFVILRQFWLFGAGAKLVPTIGLAAFRGWLFDHCLPFIRAWAAEPW
jgi:Ser/Thr protein kinase RdoA (MazF antagonist)